MGTMGVADLASSPLRSLSGGQQQRVYLAQVAGPPGRPHRPRRADGGARRRRPRALPAGVRRRARARRDARHGDPRHRRGGRVRPGAAPRAAGRRARARAREVLTADRLLETFGILVRDPHEEHARTLRRRRAGARPAPGRRHGPAGARGRPRARGDLPRPGWPTGARRAWPSGARPAPRCRGRASPRSVRQVPCGRCGAPVSARRSACRVPRGDAGRGGSPRASRGRSAGARSRHRGHACARRAPDRGRGPAHRPDGRGPGSRRTVRTWGAHDAAIVDVRAVGQRGPGLARGRREHRGRTGSTAALPAALPVAREPVLVRRRVHRRASSASSSTPAPERAVAGILPSRARSATFLVGTAPRSHGTSVRQRHEAGGTAGRGRRHAESVPGPFRRPPLESRRAVHARDREEPRCRQPTSGTDRRARFRAR